MKALCSTLRMGAILFLTAGSMWLFVLHGDTSAAAGPSGYHLVKKVLLGGEGFWDYFAIDPPARHVFITHNNHVMVLDADSGKIVGDVADVKIRGVHGVAVVEEAGRGFTSNGETDTVTIFDLKTFKPLDAVAVGKGPDAIIYDRASHRVFTFNGKGQDSTAIDAASGKIAGSIFLGGKPEFAAADGAGGVYVNIEDKNEVAVIDSRAIKLSTRWPVAPCEEPAGMAIDAEHGRLFIGCHNKMMAVMDTKTGKIVATPPIGARVDANRFDPGTGLAFSSNGEGTLTVIHEDTPDKYTVIENVATEIGARTLEVDPKTHNVYLVTADLKPTPPTAENPHPYPTVLPGTLRLLIFAK